MRGSSVPEKSCRGQFIREAVMAIHDRELTPVSVDHPTDHHARCRGRAIAMVIASLLLVFVAAVFLLDMTGYMRVL